MKTQEYTILGWLATSGDLLVSWADGVDAFAAVERACEAGDLSATEDEPRRPQPDWKLVAVLSGAQRPAAGASDMAAPVRSSGPGRAEKFTVVGFWVHSRETFYAIEQAQTAVQAMRLVGARNAGRQAARELQLVGAFPGEHRPVLTRENCPNYW